MKLIITLLVSAAIHGYFSYWYPEADDSKHQATAGRATLAIQQMRFVKTKTESQPDKTESVKAEPVKPETLSVKKKAVRERSFVSEAVAIEEVIIQEKQETAPQDLDMAKKTPEAATEEKQQDVPQIQVAEQQAQLEVVTTTEIESEYSGADHASVMAQPRYRKASPPRYPRISKRRGQQGIVIVRAKVGRDGFVNEVLLANTSGYRSLDEQALKSVAGWEFYPMQVDGQLSVSWVEVPVEFRL